ncbi:MAG: hypothetical protein WC533_04180 [Candidatus Pacearchaeota archaeon]
MKNKQASIGKIVFVLIGFLAISLIVFGILVYKFVSNNPDKPFVSKPGISDIVSENVSVQPEHVQYLLNEMGAYKLHNSPLTSNTPKIELVIDGESFSAEVVDNKIIIIKEVLENEDIRFITSKEAIFEAIKSDDIVETFKSSIEMGESNYEIVGDKKTLFLKGYLSIYEEITGQKISATAEVINSFK